MTDVQKTWTHRDIVILFHPDTAIFGAKINDRQVSAASLNAMKMLIDEAVYFRPFTALATITKSWGRDPEMDIVAEIDESKDFLIRVKIIGIHLEDGRVFFNTAESDFQWVLADTPENVAAWVSANKLRHFKRIMTKRIDAKIKVADDRQVVLVAEDHRPIKGKIDNV